MIHVIIYEGLFSILMLTLYELQATITWWVRRQEIISIQYMTDSRDQLDQSVLPQQGNKMGSSPVGSCDIFFGYWYLY